MTDVLQIVDSTLAVADQVVQTVEVGYIAQTVQQGGGTPSGTVVSETTYGQAATAGAATAYSRGDHTHGSPPLGTTGSTAAAGNHLHTGVYDAAGAASSALTTAEAYTDTQIGTVIPKSLVTAKGDLIGASGTGTPVRVPVGSDGAVLLADSSQSTGLRWGAGSERAVFPLSHYGLVAATGNPNEFQRPGGVSSGDRFIARMFVPAGVPFSKLWCAVTTAGTWDGTSGPNQIVLFDDNGNVLTSTPDTGTTWTTAGWRGGTLGGSQTAQGADRFVYVEATFHGITGCQIAFPVSGSDNGIWFAVGPGQTKRRGIYSTAASVPNPFDPASFGTASSFIPLIGAQ